MAKSILQKPTSETIPFNRKDLEFLKAIEERLRQIGRSHLHQEVTEVADKLYAFSCTLGSRVTGGAE